MTRTEKVVTFTIFTLLLFIVSFNAGRIYQGLEDQETMYTADQVQAIVNQQRGGAAR